MKKFLPYITALIISALIGVILPAAFAQGDIKGVEASLEVSGGGCLWDGTPGISTSNLLVPDGDTCIIDSTQQAASVTVEADGGAGGGTLIIGSTSDETDVTFTAYGMIDIQGTATIGRTGNPLNSDAIFAYSGAPSTYIRGGGSLTTTLNNNGGSNYFNLYRIYVGYSSPATSGTLTLNDNATSQGYLLFAYNDSVINNNSSSTLTITYTSSTAVGAYIYQNVQITNSGNFNLNANLRLYDSGDFINNGTLNTSSAGIYIGYNSGADASLTNSNTGIIDINNASTYNDLYLYYDSSFTNNGGTSIDVFDDIYVGVTTTHNAVFNNNTNGTITNTASANSYLYVYGKSTVNNNYGTINTDRLYTYGHVSDTAYQPTINNGNGTNTAALNSPTGIYMGADNNYSGIIYNKNAATLTVSTVTYSYINGGGIIENQTGGVVNLTRVQMTGKDASAEGTSTLKNYSTTGNAFTISEVLYMSIYTKVENSGAFNLTYTTGSGLSVSNNNTDIVNNSAGVFTFKNSISPAYDFELNNYGTVNFDATNGDVTLGTSAKIINWEDATFNSAPTTPANSTLTINGTAASVENRGIMIFKQNLTISSSGQLLNYDPTGTATLTIDNGTATVNYLTLNNTSSLTNGANATLNVGVTGTLDGQIITNNTSTFSNSGTVTAKLINLEGTGLGSVPTINNSSLINVDTLTNGVTSYGGTINNQNGGTFNINGAGDSTIIRYGGKVNNLSGGVFDIDGNISTMLGTDGTENGLAKITNASTTGNAFRVTGTITMNSYSKIDNTGTFNAITSVTMNNDSIIANSGTFNVDDGGAPGAVTSFITLANGSTAAFNNATGGTVNVDDNAGGDADGTNDGEIRIYGSTTYTNNGTTNCSTLFVSAGGTLTNTGTQGAFLAKSTEGMGVGNPTMLISQGGTINNSSTCDSTTCPNGTLYSGAYITLSGTSGTAATVNSSGIVGSGATSTIFILDYSALNITGSRWLVASDVRGTGVPDANAKGQINISSGAVIGRSMVASGIASIINYGSVKYMNLDGSEPDTALNINLQDNSTFTNKTGALVKPYTGTLNLQNSAVFTNESGAQVGAPVSYVAIILLTNSAQFLNSGAVNTATLSVYTGTTFTNNSGGGVTPGNLRVGFGAALGGTFNNTGYLYANGTSYVMDGGIINNYATDPNPARFATLNIGNGTINGGTYNNIAGSTTYSDTALNVYTGGILTNNAILSTTNIFNNNAGTINSGSLSSFSMSGNPGFEAHSTSTTEFEGDVTGTSMDIDSGAYVCFGEYTGSCANSGNTTALSASGWTSGNTFDANASEIKVANDLTIQNGSMDLSSGADLIQYGSSSIQVQGNGDLIVRGSSSFESNGDLDIQGSGAGNHGELYVNDNSSAYLYNAVGTYTIGSVRIDNSGLVQADSSTTIGLNDYEDCVNPSTGNCVIDIESGTTDGGTSSFQTNGTINITSASNPEINIGSNPTDGSGELVMDSGLTSSGTLNSTSTGQLKVFDGSQLFVNRTDATHYAVVDLDGPVYVDSNGAGTDYDRGGNVKGLMTCTDHLEIEAGGSMDIEADATVTVAGSTTDVYDFMELDGTLNAGDLTVYSGGQISSGVGTSTNFYINADNVDVQSGGKISSDGVSTVDRTGTGTGGGSYAGEGLDSGASPVATYGTTKATTPDYGMSGEDTGTLTANGGGGVELYADGNITINGEISADGADGSSGDGSGSGGTVIITHSPTATGAFFTGSGTISANGGSGAGSYPGGGGRIVIDSKLLEEPDFGNYDFGEATAGVIQANGGTDGSGGYAAAGTIVYLGDSHNSDDTLIIDQNGNDPDSGYQTDIADTVTFARTEVRENSNADLSGVTTAVCYVLSSSTVTGTTTCNSTTALPDKPDTLYINNSVTGAGSGSEPGKKSGKTGVDAGVSDTALSVGDLTPVFSVIYRNPDSGTSHTADKLHIQVDDDSAFGSPIWDDAIAITDRSGGSLNIGERTSDVEYAGTTALTPSTPYYVRVRFTNTAETNNGLWSHADYNNQYKFIIENYMDLIPNCDGLDVGTDTFNVEDFNNLGSNIRIQSGHRFGKGTCKMDFEAAPTSWQIQFGMAATETIWTAAFNTATDNSGDDINPIPYTTDCTMTPAGTVNEEKYGFNIASTTDGAISDDSETCVSVTYSFASSAGKYHDVEQTLETIIVDADAGASGADFVTDLYVNISNDTVPSANYTLDLSYIITTNP